MKLNLRDTSQLHERLNSAIRFRIGPAGVHFFNRATGLNILVDDVQLHPDHWSAAPRQISIALTNICDLACPHCYAPKNNCSLSYSQVICWLRELDENGCLGVGFGGGEPTLYPRFADLCSYTSRNTNLAVTMTTHGHRLTDDLINELAGNVHFIRVSMDGVRATYESIRQRNFETLLQCIKKIREIAQFGINFVVNSKTFPDLNAAIEIAEHLGAAEFLLLPEVPIGKGCEIDVETSQALKEWVGKYHGKVPLSISESGADELSIYNPLIIEQGLYGYAHIDASGVLKSTSYENNGVKILDKGVMAALRQLKANE